MMPRPRSATVPTTLSPSRTATSWMNSSLWVGARGVSSRSVSSQSQMRPCSDPTRAVARSMIRFNNVPRSSSRAISAVTAWIASSRRARPKFCAISDGTSAANAAPPWSSPPPFPAATWDTPSSSSVTGSCTYRQLLVSERAECRIRTVFGGDQMIEKRGCRRTGRQGESELSHRTACGADRVANPMRAHRPRPIVRHRLPGAPSFRSRSRLLQANLFVRRRPWIRIDQQQPRLLHARADPARPDVEEERRDDHALVHDPLDPVQERLALAHVRFDVLLPVEIVEIGIPPIGVGPAGDDRLFETHGRIAISARSADAQPAQLLGRAGG